MPRIDFKIINQELNIVKTFAPLIANSVGYLTFSVVGIGEDSPWSDLSIYAEFKCGKDKAFVRVKEGEEFFIPPETIQAPGFSVSFFGIKAEDEEEGKITKKRLTTNVKGFNVEPSGGYTLEDKEREELFLSTFEKEIAGLGSDVVELFNITEELKTTDIATNLEIEKLQEEDNYLKSQIEQNDSEIDLLKNKDASLDNEIAILKEKDLKILENISLLNDSLQSQIEQNDFEIDSLKEKDISLDSNITALQEEDLKILKSIDSLNDSIQSQIISLNQEDEKINSTLQELKNVDEIFYNLFTWNLSFNELEDVIFYQGDFDIDTEDFNPTISTKVRSEYLPVKNVRYSSNKGGYEVVFFKENDGIFKFYAYGEIPERELPSEGLPSIHFSPPEGATHFVVCTKKDAQNSLIIQAEINYRDHKIGFQRDLAGATQKIVDDTIGRALYAEY